MVKHMALPIVVILSPGGAPGYLRAEGEFAGAFQNTSRVERTGDGLDRTVLPIDDRTIARFDAASLDDTVDVGMDGGTPVTVDYKEHDNPFTGKVQKVIVEISPMKLVPCPG